MARPEKDMEDSFLYRRYVRALEHYGDPRDERPSPGHVIRHCSSCGMRAMFRLDPEGMWYECLHCGTYA
jgi:hypothetical protein